MNKSAVVPVTRKPAETLPTKTKNAAATDAEVQTDPTLSAPPPKSTVPLDFSFKYAVQFTDFTAEEPRPQMPGNRLPPTNSAGVCDTSSIKLNNNQLAELTGIMDILQKKLVEPMRLSWIDISFNALTTIDPLWSEFENLKVLYLHGNGIEQIAGVAHLQRLAALQSLTLHGNPVDQEKGYRFYVLTTLPRLKNLDFSVVTKADRVTATHWSKCLSKDFKKKHESKTDDD